MEKERVQLRFRVSDMIMSEIPEAWIKLPTPSIH